MSTEIVKGDPLRERLDLFKRTYAKGATDDELRLHFELCSRQGVDPMDRLIHFQVRTDKRGARTYTPITSIDFMRMRAGDSGEYAGNDDPVFKIDDKDDKYPLSATVTVWRIVQGQRCPFTATARWEEYKPFDLSDSSAFMWRKMPYTMLGKCGEALALRKGFPKTLHGLYAKEEMDQSRGQERMAPEQAQAYVKEQMAALQEKSPMLKAAEAAIPRDIDDPGPEHLPDPPKDPNFEEVEGADAWEVRLTVESIETLSGKNGPYRQVKSLGFWQASGFKCGYANCFIKEEFDTLDAVLPGQLLTVILKKRPRGCSNIVRVLDGAAPPEPQALFVASEGDIPF